jgi:hypothetical protein
MKKLLVLICMLSTGSLCWAQATAPPLGSAASFAVLGSSTVTCTGATTITGDLGVSPGTAFTGFPTPCTVVGMIHAADATSLLAHADATKAYAALLLETCITDLTGKDLGGMTLAPGIYCFSSSAGLTGQLTLSGNGVYVFKIGSTLTTASNSSVVLTNGALCGNVFWQIGSSATLGTGTTFVGNLIALTSDTVTTNVNVAGRVFALGGAVTLDTNIITAGACASGGGGGVGGGDGDDDDDNNACHDDRDKDHHDKDHHKGHHDKDKDRHDKDKDHRDDDKDH